MVAARSDGITCSIRSSNLAFCRVGAESFGSRPTPAACSGFFAWAKVCPSGVVTAVVASRGFGSFCVDGFELFTELGSSRASPVLACLPAASRLSAHLCSFGRAFACRPFAPPPCGDDMAVQLRLSSSTPSGTFHSDRPCPCRAHLIATALPRDQTPAAALASDLATRPESPNWTATCPFFAPRRPKRERFRPPG